MLQHEISLDDDFSFNHLSPTQFEEFCFELLECLDFTNINWRKGTGFSSSPSDQGRDIECERVIEDVDGEKNLEKWFVECKHYKSGVSPDKIQGVLSWASSKRPDKVLIIVSNFLSNPCKNCLEDYTRENNPPFKIKYWEKKNLERIAQGQSLLLKKYNIGFNFSFLNIMHPSHLNYIKEYHINTLDSFFEIMDDIEATMRDKILGFPYHFIINPRMRKPVTGKETHGDLYIDEISYESFKTKCYEIEQIYPNIQVANYVIDMVLKIFLDYGDITSLDQKIKKLEDFKEFTSQLEDDKEFEEMVDQIGSTVEETIKRSLKFFDDSIGTMSERTEEHYSIYTFFCENVLSKLLKEEISHKFDTDYI